MTPDWSKNPQGVPYADFTDPQTLNLYSYVRDTPLSKADPNGHCTTQDCLALFEQEPTNEAAKVGQQQTQSQAQAQQHKATVIFGETSGLRSEVGKSGKPVTTPGADPNLKTARENVADISARNSGVYSRTPTAAELKNPQVRAAWQASQAAAAGSNGSLPGYHFFLRQAGVGRQRPSKAQGWGQGKPIRKYGPFNNVGGGDAPKGNRTYIDIYNR